MGAGPFSSRGDFTPPIRAFCRSLPGYNAACLSLTPRFSGVWAMVSASEPLQRFPHHPRAALKSVRAILNPRPEDRRPKSELIATPAEQQPIESGHSRNSDFGLRSSDFRAAEHDLPSTGRTLAPPCHHPKPLKRGVNGSLPSTPKKSVLRPRFFPPAGVEVRFGG